MTREVLSVAQAYEADRFAAANGIASITLMENAGKAVADAICSRWTPWPAAVLCGPGNNGGDGYVVARHLNSRGWDVWVETIAEKASLKGDAAAMAGRWTGPTFAFGQSGKAAALHVDALFGAGLTRPLEGEARRFALASIASAGHVVAVDVPSGIHGDLGHSLDGVHVHAALTVTFFRKKPAHVLMPGRAACGDVVVADIGIPDRALAAMHAGIFENGAELWSARYPWPVASGHKYDRGHCLIVSGNGHASGAARLAARGALRIGAGLVSVASPPEAVGVNAAALDAIMVKPFSGATGLADLLSDRRFNAVVLGPGNGVGRATQELVGAALSGRAAVVLDADALTSFKDEPGNLFRLLREDAVLTPHAGEFERIFPGLLKSSSSRIEAVRQAAAAAGCTVLLKGPDTAISNREGCVVICTNAPPWLATAGSGDVLAGFVAGLLAQGMAPFDAACAGAWLHGEAANQFGIGLVSEDLPECLPSVLRRLHGGV